MAWNSFIPSLEDFVKLGALSNPLTAPILMAASQRQPRQMPRKPRRQTNLERFKADYMDAASTSLNAPVVRKVADWVDLNRRPGETEEAHDARIVAAERIRRAVDARRRDNDPVWRDDESLVDNLTSGRWAASGLGAILGGADPSYFIAPGNSAGRRIAGQAAASGAADAATQGVEVAEGVRKREEVSAKQTVAQILLGGVFQGGAEGLLKLARGDNVLDDVDMGDIPVPGVDRPFTRQAEAPVEAPVAAPRPGDRIRRKAPEATAMPEQAPTPEQLARVEELRLMKEDAETKASRGKVEVFPDPADPSLYKYSFTTKAGNEISGKYTLEDGRIDNFDIDSSGGRLSVGGKDLKDIATQLASLHPEAKTLSGFRMTGAGKKRFVDLSLPRMGRGTFDEPGRPTAEKMAGSVNTDRLGVAERGRAFAEDVAPRFDKRYRSREETRRLADEVGLTEDEFLRGRPKTEDLDVYATRSRDLSSTAIQDVLEAHKDFGPDSPEFDGMIRRAVQMLKQTSAVAGDIGRAQGAGNIQAKDLRGRTPTNEAPDPKKLGTILDQEDGEEILTELLRKHGGNPDALAKVLRDAKDPDATDYLRSYWVNLNLSGPLTHLRNIVGTGANLAYSLFGTQPLKVLLGAPRGLLKGDLDRVTVAEYLARWEGLAVGFGKMLEQRRLQRALSLGSPLDFQGRDGTNIVYRGDSPFGKAAEITTRVLAVEDEFFRSLAYESELYGLATRQALKTLGKDGDWKGLRDNLVSTPLLSMAKTADDYAKRVRFQDKPSFIARQMELLTRPKTTDDPLVKGAKLFLWSVMPFRQTPDSILRTAGRNSPLGILSPTNRAGWKQGGAARDEAIANVALGTGAAALMASLVNSMVITGNGPSSAKRRADLEVSGWRPNTIVVGDTAYSYKGIGPPAVLMSSIATAMERFRDGEIDQKEYSEIITGAIIGAAGALSDESYFNGLADLAGVFAGPEESRAENAKQYFANLGASWAPVPAAMRQMNDFFFDGITRDTTGDGSLSDRFANRIKAGVPGVSETLPARRDVLGREKLKKDSQPADAVADEIARLTGLSTDTIVGPATRTIKKPGADKAERLGDVDYSNYQLMSGEYIRMNMAEIIQSPEYKAATDEEKVAIFKEVKEDARKWAREDLFGSEAETPVLTASKSEAQPEAEAEEEAEDFVSGYPTSMRRTPFGNALVGGQPDSRHLSGQAIDLVPHPGYTLEDVAAEAAEAFPGALILIEKDHVHVASKELNLPYYGERGSQ